MRKQFKIFAFIAITLCFGCSSSSDDGPTGTGNGGTLIEASYKVTFTPNFTTEFHPTDYPTNATFIKPIIVIHSNSTSIFSEGSFASAGLGLFSEEGDSSGIFSEHTQVEDNINPTTITQGSANVGPTQTMVYTINFTPDKTLFSFVTKLSPSPDWFLGVDSFNILKSDNTLIESASFKLYATDAGTKAGETYTSDDGDETNVIAERTGLPLSNVVNEPGKFIGILTLERNNTN